jgi:hypothetical protein
MPPVLPEWTRQQEIQTHGITSAHRHTPHGPRLRHSYRLSDSNHEILVVKKCGRAVTQAYASAWSHVSLSITS